MASCRPSCVRAANHNLVDWRLRQRRGADSRGPAFLGAGWDMVSITVDGRAIEAEPGAPLVEVLKNNGVYVSSLCYIDGLKPYAGCRTCLVDIEGPPGLQLSCTATSRTAWSCVTETEEVKEARQGGAVDHPREPQRPLPHLSPARALPSRRHLPARRRGHAPLPDVLEELPLRAAGNLRNGRDVGL